jgi:hypothetical protein
MKIMKELVRTYASFSMLQKMNICRLPVKDYRQIPEVSTEITVNMLNLRLAAIFLLTAFNMLRFKGAETRENRW